MPSPNAPATRRCARTASACWNGGADFLVTSVGAFTDTALFERLLAAARANGKRLILPSAGIGALDILSSAAVGGLDSVTVTVRKDPSAWKGTVAETLVDLDSLTTAAHRVRRPGARGRAALSAERQHLRRRRHRRASASTGRAW